MLQGNTIPSGYRLYKAKVRERSIHSVKTTSTTTTTENNNTQDGSLSMSSASLMTTDCKVFTSVTVCLMLGNIVKPSNSNQVGGA